ncbi:recombinase family protein [Aliiglaciecola sp. M165]|uniref:recombinase family protein n=1 Tax=Aliiglaciecola sp. M165 TaxID=2593649 RepID=UPI00117F3C4D|nr:recombinase family protein [Aliiglaciecola sp. M165]TRY29779.1 recombinase family protein [Aliiglaciecola sp. M165]
MNYIAYFRVSTKRQSESGLGLEAQREAVNRYIKSRDTGFIVKDFTEIESGKSNNRPILLSALNHCKLTNSILIIAKLDRLSRCVHFLSGLMRSNVNFVCCDYPDANKLTIHILAAVAEDERNKISERTKAALQAAKARGIKLGNPSLGEVRNSDTSRARERIKQQTNEFHQSLKPIIESIMSEGIRDTKTITEKLNQLGIKSRRGKKLNCSSVRFIIRAVFPNG